jgi:hypothetical protein
MAGALAFGLPYVGLALAAVAVIVLLAWAAARTTVYSVTSARILMRVGAALPVTLNLPFRQIGAADLDLHCTTTAGDVDFLRAQLRIQLLDRALHFKGLFS